MFLELSITDKKKLLTKRVQKKVDQTFFSLTVHWDGRVVPYRGTFIKIHRRQIRSECRLGASKTVLLVGYQVQWFDF